MTHYKLPEIMAKKTKRTGIIPAGYYSSTQKKTDEILYDCMDYEGDDEIIIADLPSSIYWSCEHVIREGDIISSY